jgi:putative endonuclease
MFFAYILQSEKTKRYYVGSTDNLGNRLKEHNSEETVSIRRGIPWKIVHTEQFRTRSEAIRKEKQIKARGAQRYLNDLNKSG